MMTPELPSEVVYRRETYFTDQNVGRTSEVVSSLCTKVSDMYVIGEAGVGYVALQYIREKC